MTRSFRSKSLLHIAPPILHRRLRKRDDLGSLNVAFPNLYSKAGQGRGGFAEHPSGDEIVTVLEAIRH